MALKYYKNLDGVRGVAVLMVMLGHFFMVMHSKFHLLNLLLSKISILGQLGVTLFFVLSGFLITRILLDSKNQKYYFKNFYLRRILRIFPLYYFFLAIFYLIRPLIFNQSFSSFSEQCSYYLYLQNFAITFNWSSSGPMHFWSLAIEEHFYLFWPFLIFVFNEKQLVRTILGISIFSILLRYCFVQSNIEVFYFTFTRIDSLAIGSFLAILEKSNFKIKIGINFYFTLFYLISIPTAILWIKLGGDANRSLQIYKYTIFSLLFFSLIGLINALNENRITNLFLGNSFLTFTGRVGYGLYVYHFFAFELIGYYFKINIWYLNFIISFSTTYLLAWLSYNLFESKFLKLKRYFSYE